jgi:hypothetical protein
MREYYDKLIALIEGLPNYNSNYGGHELSGILSQYKSILDAVNQTNEDYKRNTNLYYTEISGIELGISQSHYAKSQKRKDEAFSDARNGLKSDIEALANLIKFKEKFD